MSPKYKLTYFNGKGIGESLRWLLAYSGEEFEDIRFTIEEWPSIKPTIPYGKLPVLDIDGKKASQSVALARYLGKQAGLGGKDAWEDLQIDIIVDTIGDFRNELTSLNLRHDKDEKVKAEKIEKFAKEIIPFYMNKFDAIVKENNGYVANGKLSWGDIYLVSFADFVSTYIARDILAPYSNLAALQEKITSTPKIKAWIDKRPKSEF
uniref:glutathione transferase n=1 Tax=Subpsaltria yangi TaxID=1195109 RepID=A0A2L1DG92_9HEMI|nr:glutathione S-transferase 6 [Subpsaltria yangi]